METTDRQKFIFQRNIAIIGVILFIGKLVAWKLTNSDAIFSDAMESIVNIIAGFMGLYSLYLSAKPRDEDHPYGRGKVEFITAGVEGALIMLAGVMIIAQGTNSLFYGKALQKLDWGIVLMVITAVVNFLMGYISYQKGVKENSLVLQSSGKHLQSDTVTTAGVILSLMLVYFTNLLWLDAAVALIFGAYIIFVGYGIIRRSLGGILDKTDTALMERLALMLQQNRQPQWIDVHNFRIQQYGNSLHIDGHITLPWYLELKMAHCEMESMIKMIAENARRPIEFNIHMDDCKPFSCEICSLADCPVRQHTQLHSIQWTVKTISQPDKHRKDS